ncbi:MAG TPA: tRNA (adenosine(37)-N6)-dimethylallyltransferase MiaA [Candidatus Azosocius sp. HAIN]
MMRFNNKIIFLMGVTSSGKTNFSLQLSKSYPFEIVNVDSVMIYKYFNIGSGKLDINILNFNSHYLIDFLYPNIIYTVSDFCRDVINIIFDIISRNKFPLLVGGTMMYFLALEKGLSFLPNSDIFIRNKLLYLIDKNGFNFIYYKLKKFHNDVSLKYKFKDKYRLLRLFEILILTGNFLNNYQFVMKNYVFKNLEIIKISLFVNKFFLFKKIENRIYKMLKLGFIDEVKFLYNFENINKNLLSLKSIGYKQIFFYLFGYITFDEMINNTIFSTKKLIKNQITWLKSNHNIYYFNKNDLSNIDFRFFFDFLNLKKKI